MAAAEGEQMNFSEPSTGDIDLNVNIVQQGRDYSEHFQMYKFYYVMKIEFSRDADNVILISNLLNIHFDAMERVFQIILQTMIESVQLQHFNRDHIIESDYIQFTMEHVDFTDYVYSSRNVSYANFTYARIVGGTMNWLSNLAQSNRQIDISHDWVVALQVSRIEEVPRGFGKKRKLNEENGNDADDCQFPVMAEVCQNKAAKMDIESCMPTQEGSPVFNPSYVVDIQHEKETEDEEYALFGTPSNSPTSSAESDSDDGKDDEMDADAGTLFKPRFNVEALNFFVNNEMNNSENVVDYFDEEIFSGTPIEDECLLISVYVHYIYLTQSNNFERRMKEKKWLGKLVEKKLVKLKRELSNEFGKNLKGWGHWREIEFIRQLLLQYFPTNFSVKVGSSQPMVNLIRSNCNLELMTYPTYVL